MKNTKLFITGSESFVGKEVIKFCQKNSYKYLAIDKNAKNTKYTKKFDIRSGKIHKIIPKNCVVIHLAAISNNNDFDKNPLEGMNINIDGTINLFLNAKKKNCKKFIFASTEWVYGDQSFILPKDENVTIDIQKLHSKYAISKILAETYLKTINYTNLILLRFGIIYSSKRSRGSAVESIFSKINSNNVIEIGSKLTSRRFVSLNDIVKGIFKAVKFEQKNGKSSCNVFNLTGNKLITLKEIINKSMNVHKKKVEIIEKDTKSSSIRNIINIKAKKKLKWSPKSKLIDDLKELKKYINKNSIH